MMPHSPELSVVAVHYISVAPTLRGTHPHLNPLELKCAIVSFNGVQVRLSI